MINPSDFYFLVLYEAVMEGNETNDDSKFSKSEQIRAIRCVKNGWIERSNVCSMNDIHINIYTILSVCISIRQ